MSLPSSMINLAKKISDEISAQYGFEKLTAEHISSLANDLDEIHRKICVLRANSIFSQGLLELLSDLDSAVQRVKNVGTKIRENDKALLCLKTSPSIPLEDVMDFSILKWIDIADLVHSILTEKIKDIDPSGKPFKEALWNLDIQTILGGYPAKKTPSKWLRQIYIETYPGKPFEKANDIQGKKSDRWGPGPLFISIATEGLTVERDKDGKVIKPGKKFNDGEAIRKAAKRVRKSSGDIGD